MNINARFFESSTSRFLVNNSDETINQSLTTPNPSRKAPNTCKKPLARTAGNTLSGAVLLADTQEVRPPYSPNGSQPSDSVEVIDPETGEVRYFEQSGKPGILTPKYTQIDHQNTRAERWAMKWALDALLPESRQWKCHRYKIPGKELEVKLSLEHQKAFYAGFECCGSVWGYPLCAPKITERRRVEVNQGIERAKDMGFKVMLATFTIPHGLGDDVDAIRKQMLQA